MTESKGTHDMKVGSDSDIDRIMMDEPEMYVQGRFAQMILQDVGRPSKAYYDAAQLRAAFRAGYDYANKAALRAAKPADGWHLVPVEPTTDMLVAYHMAKHEGPKPTMVPDLWQAMVAAASLPAAPQETSHEGK